LKNFTIYLSGKMSGLSKDDMNSWRSTITDKLRIQIYYAKVVNPVDYYNTVEDNYDTDKEYIRWELRQAQDCSVIIVGWNKEQDSLGTMAELTAAYINKIPIIIYLYDTKRDDDKAFDVAHYDMHPFVRYMSDKIFYADEADLLVEYVRKYMFLETIIKF